MSNKSHSHFHGTWLRAAMLPLIALHLSLTTSCQAFRDRQMAREWEALNDTIADCSRKIQNIVGTLQMSQSTSEAAQRALLHDIDSIDRAMKGAILRCAERNKNNELGRYIRQNYSQE